MKNPGKIIISMKVILVGMFVALDKIFSEIIIFNEDVINSEIKILHLGHFAGAIFNYQFFVLFFYCR